jgi:hypothetical protein
MMYRAATGTVEYRHRGAPIVHRNSSRALRPSQLKIDGRSYPPAAQHAGPLS